MMVAIIRISPWQTIPSQSIRSVPERLSSESLLPGSFINKSQLKRCLVGHFTRILREGTVHAGGDVPAGSWRRGVCC